MTTTTPPGPDGTGGPGRPGAVGAGYDPAFLAVPVPLPTRRERAEDLLELPYTHFTVVLDIARRLAATTACTVDGATLLDLERGDDWFLDPRVPVGGQAGSELYARNDLDRGHLVRRRDPVWGPPDVARRANADTFAYTNAAPQAAEFNQGMELWLGLEDHVLAYADSTDQRLVVVTSPVLADDDPLYRGVRVPRRFTKVVAWTTAAAPGPAAGDGAAGEGGAVLASAGFVLDQTPQLDELDIDADSDVTVRREAGEGGVPPLGPFRSFQVPVSDVEALTGLDLGPLAAADRGAGDRTVPTPLGAGWVRLHALSEVRLGA